MKNLIIFIFSTMFCSTVYGQQDKQKIIKTFDKVTYYADSTLKCAYFTKHHKFDGYSIEFDTQGQPIAIGKYWKGKKHSYWIHPDNQCEYYTNGNANTGLLPTCRTGQPHNFNKLYSDILSGTTR